eukprot:TRINITY_DN40339_c0_g1_i1.p1 TRINITY_DN40339_c0_g1~~TRINITY_DN40339_c0_g1_i1.p1  ORF type:complete len:1392 (-),score=288.56 TRINITY_DN40339_c0_g1_i1:23-4198(-)
MSLTPRCSTPQPPRPSSRASSNLSNYGVAARASTPLPPTRPPSRPSSRPGSSLASSRGPSRAGRASPLGNENLWRDDATWPVKEGGTAVMSGANCSLDVDLDLARRRLAEYVAKPEMSPRKRLEAARKAAAAEVAASLKATRSASGRGSVCEQKLQDEASANQHLEEVPSEVVSSVFEPPMMPGEGALPGFPDRSSVIRWCFRLSKEQIEARIQLLDVAVFGAEHRGAVYFRRDDELWEDTALAKLHTSFHDTNLPDAPQASHPASLDSWPFQEGGISRTGELLSTLEVLNFYRWLCGVRRLKLDSYLQELADMMLQILQKRHDRTQIAKASEEMEALCTALEEFDVSEGLKLAVVSHVPSATAATRFIFSGLPAAPTSDGGPLAIRDCGPPPRLPEKAEGSLEPYLPFLRLAKLDSYSQKRPSKSITELDPWLHRPSAKGVYVPDGPPPALPAPPGAAPPPGENFDFVSGGSSASGARAGKWRKSRAWGDTKGVVGLRRQVLDPRVEFCGLLRRGCSFCLWVPPREFDGMPEEDMHDEDEPEEDFLDIEKVEAPVKTRAKPVVSPHLQKLLQWREEEPWRKLLKKKDKAGGANMRLEDKHGPPSEIYSEKTGTGWQVMKRTFRHFQPADISAGFARASTSEGDVQSRTEQYLRRLKEKTPGREGSKMSSMKKPLPVFKEDSEYAETLLEPIMVCFPPPGIVPMEILSEAELMPWTISPDPLRLAPTLDCKVEMYRVKIDHLSATATRLDQVQLSSFCVDCTDVGTAFCVIFTPVIDIREDDEFEVVLSGLADRTRSSEASCCLQYFLNFTSFKRHHHDPQTLVTRAGLWLKTLSNKEIWDEAAFNFPEETDRGGLGADSFAPAVDFAKKPPHKISQPKKSALKGSSGSNDGKKKMRVLRFEDMSSGPAVYDAKHPPPIGVVNHPLGERDKSRHGKYSVHLVDTNETTLSFIIPSTTVIKATLSGFLKSQAKWEVMPHGVFQMSFDVPPPTIGRQRERALAAGLQDPTAKEARQTRVLIRIMVPTAGHYELRFQWGHVPLAVADVGQFRGVRSNVTQFDHPLRIVVTAPSDSAFKSLVPSLLHTSVAKYGYPGKHPLAEQFGLTLMQPLRYRLKRGQEVRFVVHSLQEPLLEEVLAAKSREATKDKVEKARTTPVRTQGALAEGDRQVMPEDTASISSVTTTTDASRITNEAMRQRIRTFLKGNIRCGSPNVQVRIAAVLGNWQRVELLSRRLIQPPDESEARAELHEAVVQLTNEDMAQTIQLIVFQVGSDEALEAELAARVASGRDRDPHQRKQDVLPAPVKLGNTPRPSYWVLAEFMVDSSTGSVPWDEDEMAKPPPPPPDAIQLIKDLGVGRAIKVDHGEKENDESKAKVKLFERRHSGIAFRDDGS